MKDKLVFDTTNATTIADSDSVGAFLRASDGTLLTHTDVGGKKALDVRVAEGINVEVDLSQADDSVAIGDGTNLVSVSASGELLVRAVNLDIRDLAFATDKVDVSGSSVSISGNVNVTQGTSPWVIGDGGGSVTVDASDLDIRDLTAASDSVESWLNDGSGNAISSTGGSLNVNVTNTISVNDAALANTAIASAAETLDVANTAQNAVASPLANRKYLYIYNKDNQVMYVGQSGVTAANGFPISPGSYMELRAGAAVDIEFVSAKLNHEIRTLELS